MLSRRGLLVGGATLLLARSAAQGETPVIDPEVRAAVGRGSTRVLVELRLPGPSASPSDPVAARERAIATAREAVLARLVGTSHRLARQYASIPLLALEIGPDALRALGGMGDLVVRVHAEQVRPPTAPR